MQEIACGVCGISPREFWALPLSDINNTVNGRLEHEKNKAQQGWEQARFIASTMSKEAAKIKFPWEKETIQAPKGGKPSADRLKQIVSWHEQKFNIR